MPQLLLCFILMTLLSSAFISETRAEGGEIRLNFSVQVSEVTAQYTKMLNGVSVTLEPQGKFKSASFSSAVYLNRASESGQNRIAILSDFGNMSPVSFNLNQTSTQSNDHIMSGTYGGVFPLAVLTGNGGIARFYSLPSSVLVGSYTLSLNHPLCGPLSAQVYISTMTTPTLPLALSYAGPCKQS